jgi:hypothetical protein
MKEWLFATVMPLLIALCIKYLPSDKKVAGTY